MPGAKGRNVRWLASFPKSGNTWVRVFLANLFSPQPNRSLTLHEVSSMPFYTDTRPLELKQEFIGKAHKAYNLELHGTVPAIYIVRDPVDVVPSAAKFFNVSPARMAREVAKDWPRHIESWWPHCKLCLKYENMPGNFHALAQSLDVQDDFLSIVTAIQRSDFHILKKDEQKNGFSEASGVGGRFFRHGKPGQGRDLLTDAQVQKIIRSAGEWYKRLSYDG